MVFSCEMTVHLLFTLFLGSVTADEGISLTHPVNLQVTKVISRYPATMKPRRVSRRASTILPLTR